jgi:hypothetical protein
MGIAEALTAEPYKGGTPSMVAAQLSAMTGDLRKLAESLLASAHSDRFVGDAFTDEGYPVSLGAVRNYRRANKLQRYA